MPCDPLSARQAPGRSHFLLRDINSCRAISIRAARYQFVPRDINSYFLAANQRGGKLRAAEDFSCRGGTCGLKMMEPESVQLSGS
jgi:hypothetical protein